MNRADDTARFLAQQLSDPDTGWSLGTFGAIAEFTRDAGEPATFGAAGDALAAVTGRGGIRLDAIDGVRLFASETTTRASWNHRVSLCLPERVSAMNRRPVLTALGPDAGALREQDRDGALFDLGLETPQADLCIRVSDPAVAERLKDHVGRSLFDAGNPAMGIILAANPHRVFVSKVGRIEVFQAIPPAHGKSPDGPHTHLLPKLLLHRRTHPATEPVPDGWVPCAHFYPAHPLHDAMGESQPFDQRRHDAFQKLLRAFGEPEVVALKERVASALDAGDGPETATLPASRFARSSIRVALRQYRARPHASVSLSAWTAAFEPVGQHEEDPAADDVYRHA